MAIESDDDRRVRVENHEHVLSVVANGREIDGWTEYQVDSSLIEPADSFVLRRPHDRDAWELCRRDARVRVLLDGICIINGFIDARRYQASDGIMEISGRDIVGRLLKESAPRMNYGGLDMKQTIEALASPWFRTVTFTNARNRRIRRGKGKQVAAYNEAIQIPPKPKNQRIEPGRFRWDAMMELLSRAGCIAWSSGDGQELFVGKPNHNQPPQYIARTAQSTSPERATVIDVDYEENNADRYAMVVGLGAGANSDADFGAAVATRKGVVFDNPDNLVNGTGRDFLYPKTLYMVQQAVRDNAEASRIAGIEQWRRDFHRVKSSIEMPYHGQTVGGTERTLFAPDTVIRLIIDEIDVDDEHMIYACSYRCSRDSGETTTLSTVPRGTEIVA